MKNSNWVRWVCVLLILCLVGGMCTGCFSHDESIAVEKKSWWYNIRIEKNVLCYEDDWELPSGATLIRKEPEKYKKKYDEEGNFIGWEYRTKYYYQIWRWKYERDVTTTEENDTPYYGEPNLAHNERIASCTEYYYIHGENEKGELTKYGLGFDEWNSIGLGDTVEAKVSIFDNIVEIYEIRKSLEAFG